MFTLGVIATIVGLIIYDHFIRPYVLAFFKPKIKPPSKPSVFEEGLESAKKEQAKANSKRKEFNNRK